MTIRHGDLKDTILPEIMVDSFSPKTGKEDEVIVVAFKAIDELPANDLDTFLERGALDILDVEVSENPDVDMHFYIFVELRRANTFPDKLRELIKDVENLTGKLDWKIVPYDDDSGAAYLLEDPTWETSIILEPKVKTIQNDLEELETQLNMKKAETYESFFKNSDLLTLTINHNIINLNEHRFKIVDFDDDRKLIESNNLSGKPIRMFERNSTLRGIKHALGDGWVVMEVSNMYHISNDWSESAILLKEL